MNLYILIFSISIYRYKSHFCQKIKSCYNCSISKYNCSWYNNACVSYDLINSFKINDFNKLLSLPFISRQYKCINNEKDIEYFEEINNKKISILPDIKMNKNDINDIYYHIYCFKYSLKQNVRLRINYYEYFHNSILDISIYNNMTNSDIIINYINITYLSYN